MKKKYIISAIAIVIILTLVYISSGIQRVSTDKKIYFQNEKL